MLLQEKELRGSNHPPPFKSVNMYHGLLLAQKSLKQTMWKFSGVEINMKKQAADLKHLPHREWWSMVLGTTRTVRSYLAAQRNVQLWFLGCFNFFSHFGKFLCSLGSKTDQVDHYKLPRVKMQNGHLTVYRFLCFKTTSSLLQQLGLN